MNEEIVKAYEQLKKEYRLPDFEKINSEFQISSLENKDFLLRDIMGKITEQIEFMNSILAPIIQPDANILNDLHECRGFNDDEKKQIFELYSRLMVIHKLSLELALVNDDKEIANFINDTFKIWYELKQSVVKNIKKIRKIWENGISDIKEDLGYLG